ncbi:RHS repeat domain-containing protein [Wolbachia endosymbiont of Oryzaephilus surinamensis]|uniref:RHS repeat domain-containing protein n=1 Tax=Wolbachia endosymbiont of Oryzaephilus surinamensis TaxID=573241 RepID=UPI0021D52C6D|nr:RHS repeat-associated core domain-containing protein [Wolbachia endosymbiont of Oryzaephilus surinamensis]UXX40872.1 RHS repeat-associated core domain-containing protein [Wolbachia endosymbiont of Oryzaephilus surinamensis]
MWVIVRNITTMEDESYKTIFPNNKSIDTKSDYHYDSLYRLIQATGKEHPALSGKEEIITQIPHLNNQNAISNYTEYYDFDYGSNITKIRHNGKNSSTKEFYISSKSNRSLQVVDERPVNENNIDASYDERGNLLKLSGSQDLHWNYRDNIAYVDIITRPNGKNDSEYYVYDSSGQRVRKVTETYQNNQAHSTKVDKIYFGDIEVTRTYQENDLRKEKYTVHIMDDKSRVALHHYYTKGSSEETKNSQSRYQLSNHLDSVALELNDNAEIITYEECLPFGGTALIAGRTVREVNEKEYRYSGKERDNSTGLYYYGARYYAPWLLRWINPDPAGTVDGLNLYRFVKGNPIIYTDLMGKMPRKMLGKRVDDSQSSDNNNDKRIHSLESHVEARFIRFIRLSSFLQAIAIKAYEKGMAEHPNNVDPVQIIRKSFISGGASSHQDVSATNGLHAAHVIQAKIEQKHEDVSDEDYKRMVTMIAHTQDEPPQYNNSKFGKTFDNVQKMLINNDMLHKINFDFSNTKNKKTLYKKNIAMIKRIRKQFSRKLFDAFISEESKQSSEGDKKKDRRDQEKKNISKAIELFNTRGIIFDVKAFRMGFSLFKKEQRAHFGG